MLHLPAAILCPALPVTLSGLELPEVRPAFVGAKIDIRESGTPLSSCHL